MFKSIWNRKHQGLVTFLLLAFVATPLALAEKGVMWEKDIEKGLKASETTGKPLLIDFHAEW